MRYNRFEYTEALKHYDNVIRCVGSIWHFMVEKNNDKVDNKVIQEFIDWINLALNENCQVPSTITFKPSTGKKKSFKYKVGDFNYISDMFFDLNEDDPCLDRIILPFDYMLKMIKLWCNLDYVDPQLFIDCCHHSDIFEFMRYFTHFGDEEPSQFEKAVFKDDISFMLDEWKPYLEYSDSNYYLCAPLFKVRIKYEDDLEEWYKFAVESICETGKQGIEKSFSEEVVKIFDTVDELPKKKKSSRKSK